MRRLLLPHDPSLVRHIEERADLPSEMRGVLQDPQVTCRRDALLYAASVLAQDSPVFFCIGLFSVASMTAHLILRIVGWLFQLFQ